MNETARQALILMNDAQSALTAASQGAAQDRRDFAAHCAERARLAIHQAARKTGAAQSQPGFPSPNLAHAAVRSCQDAAKGAGRLRELTARHPEDQAGASLAAILAAQIGEARQTLTAAAG